MSPTGGTHGIRCARVATQVTNFVDAHDLGVVFGAETGFIVGRDPDTVLGADVAFVSHERMKDVENLDKFLPFAPDLAAEVLSPGNTIDEIEEKIAFYFAAGSRAVWVFNPKKRAVAVYGSPFDVRLLGEQDTIDGGGVLPGFALDLSKLFAAVKK
jgi:Uma2 family endonuclease